MLFEKKFKVVEIRDGGVVITHYLRGKRHDIKKDIELIKQKAKRYEIVGKDGMIVWAQAYTTFSFFAKITMLFMRNKT